MYMYVNKHIELAQQGIALWKMYVCMYYYYYRCVGDRAGPENANMMTISIDL